MMFCSTLQLKRPSARVFVLTALFLGMFVSAGEFVVRQLQFQELLAVPSLGGPHLQMERQWHRLETLTRSGVLIDCIALGNSLVLNGFNPQIFDQHFYEQSGEHITCFNFGVDGMPPVASSALAQILIEVYHPRLIVFGTDARDFAVAVTFDDGYADNLYNALPLLKRYQIPSTIFVCTEYLGQGFWWDELEWLIRSPLGLPDTLVLNVPGKSFEWRSSRSNRVELLNYLHRYLFSMDVRERSDMIETIREWSGAVFYEPARHRALTPDELVQLAVSGLVEIGSHTGTHPVLSSLPVEKQRDEIVPSRTQLEVILNRPVVGFAYPNGSFTSQTREIVQEAGYQYACSSEIDLVRDPGAMYQLPRFWPTDVDGNQFLRMLKIWLKI